MEIQPGVTPVQEPPPTAPKHPDTSGWYYAHPPERIRRESLRLFGAWAARNRRRPRTAQPLPTPFSSSPPPRTPSQAIRAVVRGARRRDGPRVHKSLGSDPAARFFDLCTSSAPFPHWAAGGEVRLSPSHSLAPPSPWVLLQIAGIRPRWCRREDPRWLTRILVHLHGLAGFPAGPGTELALVALRGNLKPFSSSFYFILLLWAIWACSSCMMHDVGALLLREARCCRKQEQQA